MTLLIDREFTATVIRGQIEITITATGTRHIVSRRQFDTLDARSQIVGCTRALKSLLLEQDTNADPALYWSNGGEICCGKHAPMRGSDSWRMSQWSKIPAGVIDAEIRVGVAYKCEVCK